MKTNYYYRRMYSRTNPIKEFILGFFLDMSSIARLLFEVFIRKNFGERYFSFTVAILIGFFLIWVPFLTEGIINTFSGGFSYGRQSSTFGEVIGKNLLYYLFIAAFIYFSWLRRTEIQRSASSFDFAKFSKYSGDLHPFFKNFRFQGRLLTVREIEILAEPAPFFLAGIVLIFLGQSLGWLLTFSSISYALGNRAAYHIGDNAILDIIDNIICNEGLKNYLVDGQESDDKTGFRTYSHRPSDPKNGRKVYEAAVEDIDYDEVK